ncbi:unnamed protein product [Blepharisma stoltei]|uniref:Uncharacterized protein n=1 Tax=Blepharisma stoltei TaxID=1481888 RepID=A0AAU9IYY2_9CILI|nr:unnamed protein product [Blepharisma stoltei]
MDFMFQEDTENFDLNKTLHEFFCYVFSTNCHIDEASVTSEEMRTLEELDSLEVFENLKEIVLELLRFKKDHTKSDNAELIQKNEQFETLLQKSEAEVRNHIRVEHQLKLHIESSQNRIDELEKLNAQLNRKRDDGNNSDKNADKEVDIKLKEFEERLQNELKKVASKQKENKKEVNEKIVKEFEQQLQKYAEELEKKDKIISRLKEECMKLKSKLEEKLDETEKLKQEIERLKVADKKAEPRNPVNIEYLKKKLEEKAVDLNKMQQKIKERASNKSPALPASKENQPHPSKDRSRNSRRSTGEAELLKSNTIDSKKTNTESTPQKDNTAKKLKMAPKGHIRSFSDQLRPQTAPKRVGHY